MWDPAEVCEDFWEFSARVTVLHGQWRIYSTCGPETEKEAVRAQLTQLVLAHSAYRERLSGDVKNFVDSVLPQPPQPRNQSSPLLPCEPESVQVGSLRVTAEPHPPVPPSTPRSSAPTPLTRLSRSPSPLRSVYPSPASCLARMWSEDEEPVATDIQVSFTAFTSPSRIATARLALHRATGRRCGDHRL